MTRVEFYYDFVCPYAYLAHTQIEGVCARVGADLVWKPFLLGGIFKALGLPAVPANTMPPSKARLLSLDQRRWAEHLGVALLQPETHPNRTVLALRVALGSDDVPRASKALFAAYWVRGEDVSRAEVVARALEQAGFNSAELLARAASSAIKDELFARTDEALAQGIFGAPACIVTTKSGARELFWGQDRLDFVERALR